MVEGTVTDRERTSAVERLRIELEDHGRTRVAEMIRNFTGMEPKPLWSDLKLGLPLGQNVTRVAVVADQAWIRAAAHLGSLVAKAEVRAFEPSEVDEARP